MLGWSIIASACFFGREPGDHLPGIHARLDDLQGDLAPDWLFLDGHVDDAHAAFTDFLDQLIRADLGAGAFGDGGEVNSGRDAVRGTEGNSGASSVECRTGVYAVAQRRVATADLLEVCVPQLGRNPNGNPEYGFFIRFARPSLCTPAWRLIRPLFFNARSGGKCNGKTQNR